MRTVLFAILVLAAPLASAQSLMVVFGDDGVTTQAPTDAPLGDEHAALVTWTGTGWVLRSLSEGDVPTDVAARSLSFDVSSGDWAGLIRTLDRARLPIDHESVAAQVARLGSISAALGRITSVRTPATRVRYTVVADGLADGLSRATLAALAGDEALVEMEVTTDTDTRVELAFDFESVEAWAEWDAAADLAARLAGARVHSRLDVQRRPGPAGIVVELDDEQ